MEKVNETKSIYPHRFSHGGYENLGEIIINEKENKDNKS